MKSKIISVLAAVAVFSACAEALTECEEPTNTVAETQKQLDRIKEGLRVMTKSDKPEIEKVTACQIHLYTKADGSEVVYIVGSDGLERPVVLVDPLEYRLLTERLDAVWQSLHATAEGRRRLHGKLERMKIDENTHQKVEIYADGFRHTETLPVKRNLPKAKKTHLQLKIAEQKKKRLLEKIEEQKPKGMSDKRWQMRKAFLRHRLGIPKQVTVEHDAVTGKDMIREGK